MRERRRWTVRDLRRDNRSVLLTSLFFDQPRSRPELSEATGLSPASVSNVVRELIDEGIVVEAGSVDSDGGRPRVLLQVNPDYGYVIGVDVGEFRVRVELYDLTMTERAKADYPLDPRQHDVGVIAQAILAGLDEVLARSDVSPPLCWASGSGFPASWRTGPTRSCTRRVTAGQRSRWNGSCAPVPACRCTSTTAPRRWARRSSGSARGGGPSTRSSA